MPAKNQGFTVLEVLVVIGILSVASLILIFPLLQNYQPNLQLNTAARTLTTNLRLAQQKAIADQTPYQVIFDLNNKTYSVKQRESTLPWQTFTLAAALSWQISTPAFTNNTVEFVATGAAVESGEIVISNKNNRSVSIQIKPSGYVKLSSLQ